MPVTHSALEFLSQLEQEEAARLAWGLIDGYFTEDEIESRAARYLASMGVTGIEAGELVDELLDAHFLWRLPNSSKYRTRSAEAVRLFARLRQIFPDQAHAKWRTAPSLVADYRYIVRPRLQPIRDVIPRELLRQLKQSGPITGLDEAIIRAFAREGTPAAIRFSRFQMRATDRILRASREARTTGSVISAGTGTGKTLAFYLPAYARIAELISADHWTKCLAIYPRVELLKDQLREALINARRIRAALSDHGKRGLTIGALYGDVPNNADDVANRPNWTRRSIGQRSGFRCPFVRCPDCGADMLWLEQDIQTRTERLYCASAGCGGCITGDELLLTRQRMITQPSDVLFTTTELLNQQIASRRFGLLFGVGQPHARQPHFVLLDEIHTYEGPHGAHVAYLLRRWRRASDARPHYVGLSATLADAPRFFAELVGVGPGDVAEITPEQSELRARGSEYMLALRGNPASGTSLPSTTIQALMLLRRILAPVANDPAGSRVFAFTDNLDGINRLYDDLLNAEGWERRNRRVVPRASGSLANLRAPTLPDAQERFDAGQNWQLVEDIGHVLTAANRTVISRTSSQDAGVDSEASIVVATASLEVGFDDPEVGAVLQHKAPMSSAPFLQRKGRAGRRQEMRPWTVAVLSDYGRDRAAYQSYDLLFSASLAPRHLPLGNRSVLRMQATYALFEWLANKLPPQESPDPWWDFSQPADEIKFGGVAEGVGRRQPLYVKHLRSLLEEESVRLEFSSFLRRALRVPDEVAIALVWEPPRSVLMEAIPTLLRRLERAWKKADGLTREPYIPRNPLPEFLPGALFGELRLRDVTIRLPAVRQAPERIETMPVRQAMQEFAPGRVSRRFGVFDSSERHWVPPGDCRDVTLDSFCDAQDRQELGYFSFISDEGVLSRIRVYQPLAYHLSQVPPEIQQSSNAFLSWRTEIVATRGAHVMELPRIFSWASLLEGLEFHTHQLGAPIELRRFALSASATVGSKRRPKEEYSLRFVVANGAASEPVGIGFAANVDAVKVRLRYPGFIYKLVQSDARLMRGLRVARFRKLIGDSVELTLAANRFQRQWLAQAFLGAVATESLATNCDLQEATSRIVAGNSRLSTSDVIRAVLQSVTDIESPEDEDAPDPKRIRELVALLENPEVANVLAAAATTLWESPTVEWEPWLRLKFKTTLGAAIAEAAQNLCQNLGNDTLIVDVRALTTQPGDPPEENQVDGFWLTEDALGGGGFVEAFLEEYSRDPRRFLRLLEAALGTTEFEAVGYDLARLLHIAVGGPAGAELSAAMSDVRHANSHELSMAAMKRLRAALTDCGIQPSPTLLISMLTRFLGPGTGAGTDAFFSSILKQIEDAERRLGIDLDSRVCAFSKRTDSELEQALGVAPPGDSPEEREAWRFGVLYAMLWPRGAQVRTDSLRARNPFDELADCDRLLVHAVMSQSRPSVVMDDPGWREALQQTLLSEGSCDLITGTHRRRDLSTALLHLAATAIDSGTLLLYPCVTGISREAERVIATLELPEAWQ
ncbi:MAG TPA: protein DpdJ [Gemmatimonadaceae bacterium]|nr:protein DpdJ [Gemmatimonadaceae bacterium]